MFDQLPRLVENPHPQVVNYALNWIRKGNSSSFDVEWHQAATNPHPQMVDCILKTSSLDERSPLFFSALGINPHPRAVEVYWSWARKHPNDIFWNEVAANPNTQSLLLCVAHAQGKVSSGLWANPNLLALQYTWFSRTPIDWVHLATNPNPAATDFYLVSNAHHMRADHYLGLAQNRNPKAVRFYLKWAHTVSIDQVDFLGLCKNRHPDALEFVWKHMHVYPLMKLPEYMAWGQLATNPSVFLPRV